MRPLLAVTLILLSLLESVTSIPLSTSCDIGASLLNTTDLALTSANDINKAIPLPLPGTHPPISLVIHDSSRYRTIKLEEAIRIFDNATGEIDKLRPYDVYDPIPQCGVSYRLDKNHGLEVAQIYSGKQVLSFTYDIVRQAVNGYRNLVTMQGRPSVTMQLVRIDTADEKEQVLGAMHLFDTRRFETAAE
ncbi:uncharacterized protein KY384_008876 [Bacidia gigantensis]|uniref:uncharacterized protein n=1 Tax=Bacidia gigantensis TaxID=2732470 RepID=UPI001D05059B|nr:uncharacterized protein KY384_008876 [Bacidia gigantensis]KAG8525232.1 hypothetical protein KY384_008876 [Bacidia gigantensis]